MSMMMWKEIWDWSNCIYTENKSQADSQGL